MRVVSGKYGGRILKDPKGHRTHPMSEKVRGALFNIIGDIEGLEVLDAFAGSGAIGIEALSRGAQKVWAVDVDKDAFDTLGHNRDEIVSKEEMIVSRANITSWLANNPDLQFDIVIADPPYDGVSGIALQACVDATRPNGLFVVSLPPDANFEFEGLRRIEEKLYGDAKLVFYKK